MITTSSTCLPGPARRRPPRLRPSGACVPRSGLSFRPTSAGPVQLLVDLARELCQARRAPPPAPRGWRRGTAPASRNAAAARAFGPGPTPRSPSSTEPVIAWSRRPRWMVDREAVRLVAHPLQQLRGLRVGGRSIGSGRPGTKTSSSRLARLIDGDPALDERPQGAHPGRELALAAVDHDQVRAARRSSRRAWRRAARGRPARGSGPCAASSTSSIEAKSSGPLAVAVIAPVAADLEPAVVGLLRRPALEHDHRGDGVLGRRGWRCRSPRSAPAAPPSRAPRAARRAPRPAAARRCSRRSRSWSRARLGVALGQLAQAALVAALGDPHLDRRAAALAERLGRAPRCGPSGRGRRRRPRHRGRGRVVLADELLGDLGRLALGLVLEVEALPLGEDPVADLEDLGVGVGALDRDPDQVGGADRAAGDPLALEQRADRLQPVAVERRALEVLRPPRPPPSSPPRRARPGGSGRRGSRRSRRCCGGTPRGRCSRRRAPRSA